MRILVVSDVSPIAVLGGGERALWELASRLAGRGHALRIVCRAPDPSAAPAVVHHGVPVRHFPVDRRSLLAFIWTSISEARRAVIDEVRTHDPEVLHLQQPLSAFGALTSSAGRRLPSLYTFHSPAPLEYRSRRRMTRQHRGGLVGDVGTALLWVIERASLTRAGRIHVLSDFSASLIWKLYRIGGDRVVKVPGGVDIDRFQPPPDRAVLRRELGLPERRPLLFTVRNLEPRMGLDELIRAMASLRERRPDVLLLIGGAGPLRPELEALVAALGLEGHVRFLGFVSDGDLPRYYGVADVFVLPTRALEGFGLVTVEALACGTPVLGTPVGATPEILTALKPSLVFSSATAAAMADEIERFLEWAARDPVAAERLRAESRRHAETFYSWERSVTDLDAVLRGLASHPSRPGSVEHRCPVCGVATRPGLVHGSRRYRQCPRCRTAVMPTPPSPAALRAFYEREYPARFSPAHVARPRVELFATLLDRLTAFRAPGRLLDLGCGGGHLLRAAGQRGWRALGSDVSHEACATARKAADAPVVQSEGGTLPLRDRSVDAVTMVNVLDHLADPARALADVHRVLAEGGALVVRVPNGTFHRAASRGLAWLGPLARRRGWAQYPVLHVFSFTAGGLRHLVEPAGFVVHEIRNSPLTAEGPASTGAEGGGLPGWLRRLIATAARAAAGFSHGRWLVAPSIELYARRASPGDVHRP